MTDHAHTQDILILQRTPPYGSSLAREGIDYALTSAAYDQNISILFLGDGVFQTLKNQDSKAIQQKNHGGALDVLPLYEIENLYVIEEDLKIRGITPEQVIDTIKVISNSESNELIHTHSKIIGF